MCTTGQVSVRVIPGTDWMCVATSRPSSSTLSACGAHDDVVGAGDVLGLRDAADLADERGHVGGLADFGLDEDVSLHHEVPPGDCGTGAPPRSRYRRGPDHVTRAPAVAEVGHHRERAADAGLAGGVRPDRDGVRRAAAERAGRSSASVTTPAVLATPDGRVVATTDFLLEGRHFRRDWSSAADVGHKAAARSLADFAAMGAVPTALLVALAAPPDLPVSWARELTDGLAAECARAGASVIGGDTARAERVLLAVTGLGDLAGRPRCCAPAPGPATWSRWPAARPRRRRPRPAAGRGYRTDPLVAAQRRPAPPYDAGPEAAAPGRHRHDRRQRRPAGRPRPRRARPAACSSTWTPPACGQVTGSARGPRRSRSRPSQPFGPNEPAFPPRPRRRADLGADRRRGSRPGRDVPGRHAAPVALDGHRRGAGRRRGRRRRRRPAVSRGSPAGITSPERVLAGTQTTGPVTGPVVVIRF